MSYYFAAANTHSRALWSDTKLHVSPKDSDDDHEQTAYLTARYRRQFAERPMRVLLEERPMHTKRNMVGAELYRPQKQQEQVYYGPPTADFYPDPRTGTPADYNRKLVVANVASRGNYGGGEFQARLEQLDLENTMFHNRGSRYVATIDPKTQNQQLRSMLALRGATTPAERVPHIAGIDSLFGGPGFALGGQIVSRTTNLPPVNLT